MTDIMIAAADLESIMQQTWHAYLDTEGDSPLDFAEGYEESTIEVGAAVSIIGGWRGHLAVDGSSSVATLVAARLLDMPRADVTDEDVSDGFGELANIVGGNVKALLPQPAHLSLPRVLLGGLDAARYPGAEPVHVARARWHGEPVTGALLRKTSTDGRNRN